MFDLSMCNSSNAYILGVIMKIYAYKNHDEIPNSVSDYVLSEHSGISV